ncbi:dimethyl sulfoxide reductase anchor subunit [Lysobacter capsici]|uniref:dimethyl sulfoxide reductase anchor subunit family protein n=1 Tax=Lysobacter capsici TaxID=435897 RepID=UPI001784009D|nr:DmsC/YnfH family molybdoenzyme membrane anchor subunit [Lysobacter capsici]UOF14304.1 dimethyl sulfoxide reductase anchor subunit [Lysobacter capsici]
MHPAFSVIFFTTLSGAGYGLMAWVGAIAFYHYAGGSPVEPMRVLAFAMLVALILVTVGLLSSTLHLGKPLRAWRAFSQWRTSWLSREGVMAIVAYLPALGLLLGVVRKSGAAMPMLLSAAVVVCALLTVACTAMIYASLKPIPAWRHWLVVPGYLAFALLSGAALLAALPGAPAVGRSAMTAVVLLAPLTALLKLMYWRAIDRTPLPVTRGEAVGLPDRELSVFERPHTEENYLTREMGYVLARKHARKLRLIALALFALLPLAGMFVAGLMQVTGSPETAAVVTALSALSVLLGAVVERWLFFAQAKHLVTLYY